IKKKARLAEIAKEASRPAPVKQSSVVRPDSLVRDSAHIAVDTVKRDSIKAASVPLANFVSIAAGSDSTEPVAIRTYYHRRVYRVVMSVTVGNRSDKELLLPYHYSLRLHLKGDSVLLRRQERSFPEDFVFHIFNTPYKRLRSLSVAPHSRRQVTLKASIRPATYDYLLRYMRRHPEADYRVQFYLGMEYKHTTVDVVRTLPVRFRFVNREVYGDDVAGM
ncbi:MAG: hypothetical protein JST39_18175, partial [Bacteroidetes bacterium]|nr:hypothetical protein [Bacteroidota bacterium]